MSLELARQSAGKTPEEAGHKFTEWKFWKRRKPCVTWENYTIMTQVEKLATQVHPTFCASFLHWFKIDVDMLLICRQK